jgi:hypothetical protein
MPYVHSSSVRPVATEPIPQQSRQSFIAKITVGTLAMFSVIGIPLGIGLLAHALYKRHQDEKAKLAFQNAQARPLASMTITTHDGLLESANEPFDFGTAPNYPDIYDQLIADIVINSDSLDDSVTNYDNPSMTVTDDVTMEVALDNCTLVCINHGIPGADEIGECDYTHEQIEINVDPADKHKAWKALAPLLLTRNSPIHHFEIGSFIAHPQ